MLLVNHLSLLNYIRYSRKRDCLFSSSTVRNAVPCAAPRQRNFAKALPENLVSKRVKKFCYLIDQLFVALRELISGHLKQRAVFLKKAAVLPDMFIQCFRLAVLRQWQPNRLRFRCLRKARWQPDITSSRPGACLREACRQRQPNRLGFCLRRKACRQPDITSSRPGACLRKACRQPLRRRPRLREARRKRQRVCVRRVTPRLCAVLRLRQRQAVRLPPVHQRVHARAGRGHKPAAERARGRLVKQFGHAELRFRVFRGRVRDIVHQVACALFARLDARLLQHVFDPAAAAAFRDRCQVPE